MVRGVVRKWDGERGFGFIEIKDDQGGDIFVHISDIRGKPLRTDDEVEFDIGEDRKAGKPRAENVTGGTGREESQRRSRGRGGGGDDRRGGGGGGFGGKGSGKGGRPGDWECPEPECKGEWVFASKDRCFKCGLDKPRNARTFSSTRGGGGRDSRSRSRGRGGGRGRDDSRRR